jgi:hypothetical protein
MARAPRSTVSKTSGQGISRLAYQKARSLGGNISTGSGGGLGLRSGGGGGGGGEKIGTTGTGRDYSKQAKLFASPPMNVSFGDTNAPEPGDIAGIKGMGVMPPVKPSASLAPEAAKKWTK